MTERAAAFPRLAAGIPVHSERSDPPIARGSFFSLFIFCSPSGWLLVMTAVPGERSTLLNHTLAPHYACYLLKSTNPKRSATYIGSTPDPPRRIKQHNGTVVGVSKPPLPVRAVTRTRC